MSGAGYVSGPQQCMLRVLDELGRHPCTYRSVAELAGALDASRDQVFRCLRNLEHAGWAEQAGTARWRLTPTITKISERVRLEIHKLHTHYLNQETSHD